MALKELKRKFDHSLGLLFKGDVTDQPVDLFSCRDVHTVAGLLKLYFREMYLPIFPRKCLQPFRDAEGILICIF